MPGQKRTIFAIKITTADGREVRLAEDNEYMKRRFFKTRAEAEQEVAFHRAMLQTDDEYTIQEFTIDE